MIWPVEVGRGVLVPGAGRSVIIPQLGQRPAYGDPPFFDVLDPSDVDLFGFDFSIISYPGDRIIAASIAIDPPLLSIGAPIVSGSVVQVFIGAAPSVLVAWSRGYSTGFGPRTTVMAPTAPVMTYDINCSVTFATGRVLDWGCEISVQTL